MRGMVEALSRHDSEVVVCRHPNEELEHTLVVVTSLEQMQVARILAATPIRGFAVHVQKRNDDIAFFNSGRIQQERELLGSGQWEIMLNFYPKCGKVTGSLNSLTILARPGASAEELKDRFDILYLNFLECQKNHMAKCKICGNNVKNRKAHQCDEPELGDEELARTSGT